MAEEIIKARVWTKVDTLENWNNNPLLLGPGEMALVTTPSGIPLNMKWGDKTERKRFSDLPFAISYDQGQFVAIDGPGELPTPESEVGYSLVGPGTYTYPSQSDIVVDDVYMAILVWHDSSWDVSSLIEIPTQDLSEYFKKSELLTENLFNEESLVNLVMNSVLTQVNSSSGGLSFYYPIKMGSYFRVERPVALTDRFAVGFTIEEPAPGVDLIDATNSSETFYEGISPVEGYIFIYVSSSAGSETADFSNISFVRNLEGSEIARKSDLDDIGVEIDDIKGQIDDINSKLVSGNIFDESQLVNLSLNSDLDQINSSVNGKLFYSPVSEGDYFRIERPEALTNRFVIGFTDVEPASGVAVHDVDNSNNLLHEGYAPNDGYFIAYLSTSDDEGRDFSNISFVKSIGSGEIATKNDVDRLQSEIDDIKEVLSSGNIFDEDDLLTLALGSSFETFVTSANGKVWATQVLQGDIIDAYRDEALTNRFGYGFSLQQPAIGVGVDSDYTQSSMLEYHGIVAPFDGWFFMYLSTSADSEDRDFSNINIEVKSKAKVVDNLDSNLSYASLSANMGRVLKEMIESGGGGTSVAHMFGNFNELYRESNAPDMSDTLPEMTTDQLITLIDTAISVDNRGITKEIIGYGSDANNDPDTNAPLVEYTITPTMFNPSWESPRYLTEPPVILITGGVHGNEKMPPYALYRFIEMLVSDMSDSIRSIRDNVILKIIPVAVPWAFDNHSRENINGVNINRDFGINNQNPQQETIAIKNWFDVNSTAPVYIDFHNSYYNQSGISYIITDSDRQASVFSSLTRRLSPIWKAKFLPTENDNFTRGFVQTYVGMGAYQGVAAYYADEYVGIPRSAVLEATKSWEGNLTNWYTEEVTEVNIELIINYMLATLGSMNK